MLTPRLIYVTIYAYLTNIFFCPFFIFLPNLIKDVHCHVVKTSRQSSLRRRIDYDLVNDKIMHATNCSKISNISRKKKLKLKIDQLHYRPQARCIKDIEVSHDYNADHYL